MKRKTIDDFFKTAIEGRSQKIPRTVNEPDIDLSLGIPGLALISDFVTPQEELALLAFLDAHQWRTDLSRRVIHFGGTYCLMAPRSATPEERKAIEGTILTADPVPVALEFVIERMIRDGVYEQGNKPKYCIVNEYKDNHGISAHIENFKFISPVCGLTLGDGDWMRFHELVKPDDGSVRSGQAAKANRTGKRLDIWMPSRSLLVMSGHSRDRWQHEIVRSRKGRDGEHWRRPARAIPEHLTESRIKIAVNISINNAVNIVHRLLVEGHCPSVVFMHRHVFLSLRCLEVGWPYVESNNWQLLLSHDRGVWPWAKAVFCQQCFEDFWKTLTLPDGPQTCSVSNSHCTVV